MDNPFTKNQIVIEQNIGGDQLSLFEIEARSQSLMTRIEQLAEDARNKREMIQSTLENDSKWSEVEDQIKELKRRKKDIESKHTEIIELKEDIKEINADRRDTKKSLSTYLEVYHTKHGKTEIQNANGETKEIKKSYRV